MVVVLSFHRVRDNLLWVRLWQKVAVFVVIEKLAITIKRMSFPSATVILDLFSLQDSQLAFATAGRGGGDFIEN